MRLHLDTDIGGDVDDLCALTMVLGWPGVEITGITTVADEGGRRAGYARRALELGGHRDVPVAAGVDVASGRFPYPLGLPPEEEYWGGRVAPSPGPVERAVDLLRASIGLGAVVVGVGPYSNLAELEARYPGSLAAARLVLMGGHVLPPRAGFPPWGAGEDFNVQVDVTAAETVLARGTPTLVPLSVTVETALRRAHLPALRRAGALGALLARQAEAQARDERTEERWGRPYPGLPDDTLVFLHDPLACAVALGWRRGVRVDTLPLAWERRDGRLHMRVHDGGRRLPVVVGVDGTAFGSKWLRCVRRLSEAHPRP
ncbi:MAG TPA: nucleoside hydrolase [Chloroflexota bacterium]|nr:nucleoside hydrolase [Chloroflexota bacterium]